MKKLNVDLLSKCKSGDINAFEELITTYEKLIYNISYRMFSNAEDAKDITQEVFIKIYKNINKCTDLNSFKNWACKIASNTCIDELRKRKGIYTDNIDDTLESDYLNETKLKVITPEDSLVNKENISEIQSAINRLSPEYKTLIILRDIHGMNYQEISEIMDTPLGTIKSRIHRARTNLKNILLKNKEQNLK